MSASPMTTISDEQIDAVFDLHRDAPTLQFRYLVSRAIIEADRTFRSAITADLLADLKVQYGMVGTRDVEVTAWNAKLDRAIAALGRAGQSEPVAPYCWQECEEDGTPCFDEGTFSDDKNAFDYSRPLYLGGAGQSEPVAWRPMETAPKDGTIVRLLVAFTEHPLEDSNEPMATIGGNTSDNTKEDEPWKFAGWSWQHDCFTQGEGSPMGWLPMVGQADLLEEQAP